MPLFEYECRGCGNHFGTMAAVNSAYAKCEAPKTMQAAPNARTQISNDAAFIVRTNARPSAAMAMAKGSPAPSQAATFIGCATMSGACKSDQKA